MHDERDDRAQLHALNERFIAACQAGSWEDLPGILDPDFQYLDGRTGQTWPTDRYAADLQANPATLLRFNDLVIHVAGNTATVSARSYREDRPSQANRYPDTYARRNGRWLCVHACVWPVADNPDNAADAAGVSS